MPRWPKWRTDARLARFTVTPDGCWLWQGAHNSKSYAQVRLDGRAQYVHRVIYELANGPIPEDVECDHLCRQPLCVNPDHIELVSHRENVLRGVGLPAQRARQTHCVRGHLLEGDNVSKAPSAIARGRLCNECNRIRSRIGKIKARTKP
jgi:hypothetical protein